VASKINDLSARPTTVGAGSPVSRPRDVTTGGSGNTSGSSGGSSDVHITDSASKLATLEQAVRDMPAVDQTRVTQLRSAIEQGSYQVQPEHVADQLMQMDKALAQLPND
jgi:negative regulator of flagellin synthesis FlgM